MLVKDAIEQLRRARNNQRCSDLCRLLQEFGFDVRNGSRGGGHKVFDHPSIPHFIGSNFDCGHGRDPLVRGVYVGTIIRVLKTYQLELDVLMGNVMPEEGNDD